MVGLNLLMATTPFLSQKITYNNPIYSYMSSFYAKQSNQVMPNQLSKMWSIGLNTAEHTLTSTTRQCISTMGLLEKRFKT